MSPASFLSMWSGLTCLCLGVEAMRWGMNYWDGFILPVILCGVSAFFILLSNRV